MAAKAVPTSELELLIKIMLDTFHQQYGRKIARNTVNFQFIPPRVSTRIGFELNTVVSGAYLKIRLYATAFVLAPFINPYKLENVQDDPTPIGYGDEVYVSITDLPKGYFPILSESLNPVAGTDGGPYAIQLEDLSGFIQAETGENLEAEH